MRLISTVGWVLLALAAASLGAAMYSQYKAYANLAGNPELSRRAVRRRGPFAGRQYFTDVGWRHWRRFSWYMALTFALMVLGALLIARS